MNKFISILIMLLLGPFFFANLPTISFKQGAGPDFFKKELVKLNAYEMAFSKMPEMFEFSGEGEGAAIPATETQAIIKQVLTPKDLQDITETMLTSGGSPAAVNNSVNQKINEKLKVALGPQLETIPVCASNGEPLCRPAGADFDATLKYLAQNGNLTGTPLDSIVSPPVNTPQKEQKAKIGTPFNVFENIPILKYLSWITLSLILGLLILLARLFAGSWKKTSLPLGIYLLVYASFSFISGWVIFKLAVPIVSNFLPNQKGDLMQSLITPFIRDLSAAISVGFNRNVLILSAVGLVFMIIGIIVLVVTRPTTVIPTAPVTAQLAEPVESAEYPKKAKKPKPKE